jgi:hypothetical protein
MPGSGSSPGDGPHARRAEWPRPGTTAAWHRVVEQVRVGDQKPHERTRTDRQGTHHANTTCAMSVWCFCAMRSSSGLWKTGLCSAGNLRPSHWVPKELYALPKPNQRRSSHAHRQLLSGGWVGEGAVHVLDAVLCGEGPRVPVVVERVHPITQYIRTCLRWKRRMTKEIGTRMKKE